MTSKLIRPILSSIALVLSTAYCTYIKHEDIQETIDHARFYYAETAEGFPPVYISTKLHITRTLNKQGQLETYLQVHDEKLPIFERIEGPMLGSPEYNYQNFTAKERKELCRTNLQARGEQRKKEETKPLFVFLYGLYDAWKRF